MGFQSDIYLGWQGFDKIKEVFPEIKNKTFEEIDESTFRKIPNESIIDYLSEKYKVTIPNEYLANSFQSFNGPNRDDGITEDDIEFFLFGVNLTYRYRPVFLDFRESSGGLFIKKFDRNLYEDIEWYRNYLIENIDRRYECADILVKDNWY